MGLFRMNGVASLMLIVAYLQMIGTRHINTVNLNDLIARTKASVLSNKSIWEDFLDDNTSLKK